MVPGGNQTLQLLVGMGQSVSVVVERSRYPVIPSVFLFHVQNHLRNSPRSNWVQMDIKTSMNFHTKNQPEGATS